MDIIVFEPFSIQLGVEFESEHLVRLAFLSDPVLASSGQSQSTPMLLQLQAALEAWAQDPYYVFSLPIQLKGTAFQQRVWQALQEIPCGETRTYGQLAAQLKTSARAVGSACARNPLPILFPCHRVVAAHGHLGGFNHQTTGPMLALKQALLAHEKSSRA